MADKDLDFPKLSNIRNNDELQKAIDEFYDFLESDDGKRSSALPEKPTAKRTKSPSAAKKSSARPQNIHSGHRERLRRSASNNDGLLGFTDIEVLETLLSYFIPYKDTNPISHALLKKFGTLAAVLHASPDELFTVGSMTRVASEMLPLIANAPLHAHKFDIRLDTHRATAQFFASIFIGGAKSGIYVAFLDKTFRLIAIERHPLKSDGNVNIRSILGSVDKHGSKNIIVARREYGIISSDDKIINGMRIVKEAADFTDIKLLDCLVFFDYGYYSMTASGSTDGDFIFFPVLGATGSPELADALLGDHRRKASDTSMPHRRKPKPAPDNDSNP